MLMFHKKEARITWVKRVHFSDMSFNGGNPVFCVCDQFRLKQACSVIQTSLNTELVHGTSYTITLSRE